MYVTTVTMIEVMNVRGMMGDLQYNQKLRNLY